MVFSAGKKTVTVRDIIHAAHFRGELEPCWRRLSALVGRQEHAAERYEPDGAVLQSLSEEFRYERDLITAEETERWLEERGLTLEDFNDYLLRQHLKDALGDVFEPVETDGFSMTGKLRDLLVVELWLSGELDRLAARLSWRFAALQAAHGEIVPNLVETEQAHFCRRTEIDARAIPEWLARMGRDTAWLDEILRLEAAFRQQCAAALTEENLTRALSLLRMPLTRLDVETVELDSHDAAREALLCVRDDGESMERVAQAGGYPYRQAEVALESFPEAWHQAVLRAAPGEVLEPLERGEGFQLCRLVRKREPDIADTGVRSRVERHILDRHFSELSARCIKWIIPPNVVP